MRHIAVVQQMRFDVGAFAFTFAIATVLLVLVHVCGLGRGLRFMFYPGGWEGGGAACDARGILHAVLPISVAI